MKIAILTDIHEDIVNLRFAFRKINKLKCDEVICLGDISGFSVPYYDYYKTRNASECLKVIRTNCLHVVLGNHDIHAAKIIPENCTFFDYPDNWHDLDYHTRRKLAKDILWFHEEDDLDPLYRTEDIQYLRSLPEYVTMNAGDTNILFSHYIYPNLSGLKREFYSYKNEFKQHFQFMKENNSSVSFTGHSHIKGCFSATGKKYKTHGYKSFNIDNEECCIGIPPVTSLQRKSGFCIFDTNERTVQIVKL